MTLHRQCYRLAHQLLRMLCQVYVQHIRLYAVQACSHVRSETEVTSTISLLRHVQTSSGLQLIDRERWKAVLEMVAQNNNNHAKQQLGPWHGAGVTILCYAMVGVLKA